MQSEDQGRRKTRSQLVDDDKQANVQQYIYQGYHRDEEVSSSKHKQLKAPSARKSNWSKKQKVKYTVFLHYYSDLPHWGNDPKSIPSYRTLASFIKTRSPEQCKSFHLSTMRNFKSIEEMIKGLSEELQLEEGYKKLLDRYDLEVIAFEEQHKVLQLYGLSEKKYFQNKLIQKFKETGYNNDALNSGESPQGNELDYNPKINIRELLEQRQEEERDVMEQRKEDQQIKPSNTFQPLINMHYDNLQKQESYRKSLNPDFASSINQPSPDFAFPGPQMGMGYFQPSRQMIDGSKEADKSNANNIFDPTKSLSSLNERGSEGATQQRMMEQNFKRMVETSKNVYPPFFGGYSGGSFPGMQRIPIQQFGGQFPYTMPPPGGIPYLLQPYYSHIPRYSPSIGQPVNEKQNLKQPQPVAQMNKVQTQPSKQNNKEFNEKRKQLILNCHKHWVNWLRAVTELSRRKEIKQPGTNPQQ